MLADSNRIFKDIGFLEPRVCTAGMSAAFLLFTFGSAALTDKAGEISESSHIVPDIDIVVSGEIS